MLQFVFTLEVCADIKNEVNRGLAYQSLTDLGFGTGRVSWELKIDLARSYCIRT